MKSKKNFDDAFKRPTARDKKLPHSLVVVDTTVSSRQQRQTVAKVDFVLLLFKKIHKCYPVLLGAE